ncbi:hypothetical protein PybrP1_002416 [[Pythium] brassicae (nom. inval.)]|nr:hypothetical protein PybrP1_002416 [[Pythium] brassicae (nom. inval.)]
MLLHRVARDASSRLQRVRTWNSRCARAFSAAPMRVLFFGTDDVSVATLEKLVANSQQQDGRIVESVDVICPSDRKVGGGRGKRQEPVPVKRVALAHGLDSFKTWEMPTRERTYDVGVVVSFGYFLHPHMLANLAHGAVNMHPSLLPKYRGPAPIHHALLNGDATTGVSVIEIDPRAFDVGRILLQKEVPIPAAIQCRELAQQLAAFGADCVLETLGSLQQLKASATVQDDAKASKAPKIGAQDAVLDLDTQTADHVFHRWQALSDSVGISVRFKDRVVKLAEVRAPTRDDLSELPALLRQSVATAAAATPTPGAFVFDKKRQALWLQCAAGSWLLVAKLQPADRGVGSAVDFANGLRLKHADGGVFESTRSRL